jgi:transcriptional regulator with XRE-family HTH domain
MEFPKISLKAARVNANLSQRDAAAALGVNVSTLQNYETGKTVPDWAMVKKIEDAYRFPADFIIFVKDSA